MNIDGSNDFSFVDAADWHEVTRSNLIRGGSHGGTPIQTITVVSVALFTVISIEI